MATKSVRVLSSDEYKLCTRIRWEYMEQIWKGQKIIEYRPPSQFWNVRCGQAKKFLKDGKNVLAVLINGNKKLTVQVLAIGKITTGPHFWDRFDLGDTRKDNWTPCEVWAIILGEIIESKGIDL